MKEAIQSAFAAGAMVFSPSIGYESDVHQGIPQEIPSSHHAQIEAGSDNSFELDDLSRELKVAITLAGISIVAGKYASTKRFTMHSETEQDIAAWTSFAGISAATAMIIWDTWNSSVNFLDFL